MKRYVRKFEESKEFKTVKDFLSFEGDAKKGDFVIIKNIKDNDGNTGNLEIINKGLDSSWRNMRYTINYYINNKKIDSQNFKKEKELYNFLDLNNIDY
jgi:hypothetical protein